MITGWIQEADFCSVELGELSVAVAMRKFEDHDWSSSINEMKRLEDEASEFCPPGMGCVHENGKILHVGPLDETRAYCHYHYSEQSRILGLIPKTTHRDLSSETLKLEDVRELIRRFFAGDHRWILRRLDT